MDRTVRPPGRLIAAAGLLLAASLASAGPGAPLQALLWTAPGHEAEVLRDQPAVCLDPSADRAEVDLGRALFNAPDLLGGQARRAGLSCANCHSNGRRNALFQLDGISAGPGTADVSNSFFGLERANALFDPKPIPDLALPGKVDRAPAAAKLEPFIEGLVVAEFSGEQPTPRQLHALASYVRAVRPCGDRQSEPVGLAHDLDLLDAMLGGAARLAGEGDGKGARLLLSSARRRLGLIDERMAGAALAPQRKLLERASLALAEVPAVPKALQAWQAEFAVKVVPALRRAEGRSLYDPRRIARRFASSNAAR